MADPREATAPSRERARPAIRHVAVVGAGYAGIAAAVALVRRGSAVTLFDANRTAGGRARRVDYRGATLDNGQHILLGAYGDTLALMDLVGTPRSALRREPLGLRYPGSLSLRAPRLPAPLHLASALAFCRGLAWRDRASALRLSFALRKAEAAAGPGETVATMLERHAQPARLVRLLWEPLCIAALNTPAASADAAVFARVLHDALLQGRKDSDLLLPAVDLTALLPDPALAWLGTRGAALALGRRVLALAREGSRWRVGTPDGSLDFDGVVCATAPHEAAGLLATVPGLETLAGRIGAIAHEPITTVYLQYDTPLGLPAAMTGVERGRAQWLFDRGVLCGAHGQVGAVISASRSEAAYDHDVLATAVHRDIARLAGVPGTPRWTKVITEKRATFACVPGAWRPGPDAGIPGLALAGDYTAGPYPATLEAAVRSGARAATLILDRLETP